LIACCTAAEATAPFAVLRSAAMSWWARMMLASPFGGVLKRSSNCCSLYETPPIVSDITGQADGWFFQ
jgi:hypothetical protein